VYSSCTLWWAGDGVAQSVSRLGYGLDDRGSVSSRDATASRPALGSTQPRTQWVPEVLSSGIKLPWPEADYLPPSSAEIKSA
jgi:hypothetical protein